jgi:hypothetical protein
MTSELDTYIPPSGQELEQTWQLASKLARTEFVPRDLRGKPEAVLACMLTGRELGIGPMQALRDIYVVNGRPALSATLMVTRVRAHGHRFRTITSSEQQATVQVHRHGEAEPELPVTWQLEDAKRAKLLGKDVWQQYPKAMLWARAASAACRRDCPEALGGAVYTPEEIESSNGETTTTWGRPEQMSDPPGPVSPQAAADEFCQRCGQLRGASSHKGQDSYRGDELLLAHPFQPQMSDPPAPVSPPADGRGGSDPTSEAAVDDRRNTGRLKADEGSARQAATDSASDPTSPASVRGRQRSGTATSGVGSRDAPAGSREGDPPAGSPTPDRSSGADESSRVSEGTVHHPSHMGEAPPSAPDPSSPSGPAHAQKAKAAERGDANAGSAGQEGDGGPAGPTQAKFSPPATPYLEPGEVIRWARAHDVLPSRVLTYLKREHKEDFGDLRSIADIQAFGGETAERAIAYLKAAFEKKASRP